MKTPMLAVALVLVMAGSFGRLPQAAADLEALYQAHQWFELRDVTRDAGAPALYAGMVACAFNDVPQCERLLGSVIASDPRSKQASDGRDMLTTVAIRTGRYARALALTNEALVLQPGRPSLANARALFGTLGTYADQAVVDGREARIANRTGKPLVLPALVNGRSADYIADTGANLSSISESEAIRVGLAIRDSGATVTNTPGQSVPFRVALAGEVVVGATRIRNVAFLVFRDDQQPFNGLPPGRRAILGIPVLQALGTLGWTNTEFSVGAPSLPSSVPNLCFDGAAPVAAIRFQGQTLWFNVDTGAEKTYLWPPFAKQFAALLVRAGQPTTLSVGGVGGSVRFDTTTIPELTFTIDRVSAVLRPAHILLKAPSADAERRFGNLGADLLTQASQVTFDFKSMRLTAQ